MSHIDSSTKSSEVMPVDLIDTSIVGEWEPERFDPTDLSGPDRVQQLSGPFMRRAVECNQSFFTGLNWITVDKFYTPLEEISSESSAAAKKIAEDLADDLDLDEDEVEAAVATLTPKPDAPPDLIAESQQRVIPAAFLEEKIRINTPWKLLHTNIDGHWGVFSPTVELLLVDGNEATIALSRSGDNIRVAYAGKSLEHLRQLQILTLQLFPPKQRPPQVKTEEPRVNVAFWSVSNAGGSAVSRRLEVDKWENTKINYPPEVMPSLEKLIAYQPTKSGQLMIWFGPPGTGKSWFLRNLAWEWREWCSMHYVMDPHALLTGPPNYLRDVFLHDDSSAGALTRLFNPRAGREMWRLVVLEDTGELVATTAKQEAGVGLSRLLNTADGLIGQGTRTLILITTNEEITKLHEAVTRPGRCFAKINFPAFKVEEAKAWLQHHNLEDRKFTSKGATLAELYEMKDLARQQVTTARPAPVLGFAGKAA
jgi:hypothetical protein